MRAKQMQVGEPAPWFQGKSPLNPQFHFETVAGRVIVLCFFGSSKNPVVQSILENFYRYSHIFNERRACFFGISIDQKDELENRIQERLPGFHLFWDFDYQISRAYGCLIEDSQYPGKHIYLPHSLILDERLRVISKIDFTLDPHQHVQSVMDVVMQHQVPNSLISSPIHEGLAPVLIVPNIFEPSFCQQLIQHYESLGGSESGFMREIDGKTIGMFDHKHKRRSDCQINDQQLRTACMHRIHDRLVPEIQKAFQFQATRIERYIVACYDSNSGGYFKPHRDNTTKGTAHRKFAVSLNLNTEQYSGGCLRFPEFGLQEYSPPTGGAVVFSCSLLHEATPVTSGVRYAFLPFLYDEASVKVRQGNKCYIAQSPYES